MGRVRQFVRAHPIASFALLVVSLTLLAVLASWLIDTDREKITRAISRTRAALQKGKVEESLAYVAPDFDQDGIRQADLRRYAQQVFSRFGKPNVLVTRWSDLTIIDVSATCKLEVYSDFRHISPTGGRFVRSHWNLTFAEYGDRWYITRIEPTRVNNVPVNSLRELAAQAKSYR
jgi:hypothetical protein